MQTEANVRKVASDQPEANGQSTPYAQTVALDKANAEEFKQRNDRILHLTTKTSAAEAKEQLNAEIQADVKEQLNAEIQAEVANELQVKMDAQ